MLMYPFETVRCGTKCLTFLVRARRQSSRAYWEPCIDNKKLDAYKGHSGRRDLGTFWQLRLRRIDMRRRITTIALETLGLLAGLAIAVPPCLNAQDVHKQMQNQDVQNQDVRNKDFDLQKQPIPALPSKAFGPQLILWSQSDRPQRIPIPFPHSSVPPRHSTGAANTNPTTPQTFRKH